MIKQKIISYNQTDEWNIPIPHIEFEWRENELNMAKHMASTIKKSIEYLKIYPI